MELPVKSPVSGRRKTTYKVETINLSYTLSSPNWPFFGQISTTKPEKQILTDVSCQARPGELTAIAGPSGAGKTTLLEILAGKISQLEFSGGGVFVNQRPMEGKAFRRASGYVTQEDALFPLLTVEETLTYSALLRLPGFPREARGRARALMAELGLCHVKNVRVGNASVGGVSGGERRRVSIGVDLVHDPPVILIDEPTSGLDSASALHVMTLLKSMATKNQKTIIITIHQPGLRILELVDRVVLLSNGLVVHDGTLNHLEDRLTYASHRVPRHVNVLEYAIEVIDTLVIPTSRTVHSNQETAIREEEEEKEKPYQNSLPEEVRILGKRFASNIFRTRQLFATRVIQTLVAGFLLGTIFFNAGHGARGPAALQTLIGFFAFSLTFLLSSATEALPIFLQERKILMIETSRGAYRVSSYVIANAVVYLPFLALVALLYSTPVYFLVGLRREADGFFYFSAVVSLVLMMSNSFVACFSALVPDFIMGTSVIAGLMGSFFLFSGYFIEKEKIPSYWVFMHYLSLFKYPFQCFMVNEFGGERGRRRCLDAEKIVVGGGGGECGLYGDGFLRQQGVEESQKWSNVVVMFGFVVGYRVLCFLILWVRCYKTRS